MGQPNSAGSDSFLANGFHANFNRNIAIEDRDNQEIDNQLLSFESLSSEASVAVESSETETQSDDTKSESSPTKSSKSNRHVSFSASPSVYPIENLSEYNSYEPRSSMCRSSSSCDRLRFMSGCDVITAAPSSSSWFRGVTQVPQICKVFNAQPQKCIMSKAIITSTPLADIRDVSRISSECQNMLSFPSLEDGSAYSDDALNRTSSNLRSKIPGFAHSITYEEGRSVSLKGQTPLQLSPTKNPYLETQTDEPEVPESRISQIKQRLSRKVSPKGVNENVLSSPKRSLDSSMGGVSSILRVPYSVANGSCAEGNFVAIHHDGHSSHVSDTSLTTPNCSNGSNPTGKRDVLQHSPTKTSPPASIIASKGAIAALARGPKTKTVKVVSIPSKIKIEAPRTKTPESSKVVSPNGTSARNCFSGVGNVVHHPTAQKENDFNRVLDDVHSQVRFIAHETVLNRAGPEEDVPNPFRAEEFNRDEIDAIYQQATAVAANIARAVTPDTISNLSSPSIDSIDTLLSKVRVSSDDVEGMNFGPNASDTGLSLSNDVSMESIQQWSLSDDSEAKNALNTNCNDASVTKDSFLSRGTEENNSKSIYKDVHSIIIEECESGKDVDGSTLNTGVFSSTDNVQYCHNGHGETNGNVSEIGDPSHLIRETGIMPQDINLSNANEIKTLLEISSPIDTETNAVNGTVTEETKSTSCPVLSLELLFKSKAPNSLSSHIGFASSRKCYGSVESNDGGSDHSESDFFVEAPSPSDILDIDDRVKSLSRRAWEEEIVIKEQGKNSDESSCTVIGNEPINPVDACDLHLSSNKVASTVNKPLLNQNECVREQSRQSSEEDGSEGSFCSAVSPGDLLRCDLTSPIATAIVALPSQTEPNTSFDAIVLPGSGIDANIWPLLVSANSAAKEVSLIDKEMTGGIKLSPRLLEISMDRTASSCTVDEISSQNSVKAILNHSGSTEKKLDKYFLSQSTLDGNLINDSKTEILNSENINSDKTNENVSNTATNSSNFNMLKTEDLTDQNHIPLLMDTTKSSHKVTKPENSKICDVFNGREVITDNVVVDEFPCESVLQPPVKKVSNIVSLFSNKDDHGGPSLRPASPIKPVTVKLRTSIPVLSETDSKEELVETNSGQVCTNVPGNTNSLLKYKKLKTFSSRKAIFEQLEKTVVSESTVRRSSLKEETGTSSKHSDSVVSKVSPGGSQSARSSPDKEFQKKACTSIDEERKLQKVNVIPIDGPQKNNETADVLSLTKENVTRASNSEIASQKRTSSCDSDVESISSLSAHLEKEVPPRISSPESDFDNGSVKTSIKSQNVTRSKMPRYNPSFRNLKTYENNDFAIRKAIEIDQEAIEVEPVTAERDSPASRAVRSPRTSIKFGRKATLSPNVDGYSKSASKIFTSCPDDQKKQLKACDTVSTSSVNSSTKEVPVEQRNRTAVMGSMQKKRPIVTYKVSHLSHKSSSSSTDTITAEEIFYQSSLEIKLQGHTPHASTSSIEFGRRDEESHLLRSKAVEETSRKPGSAFRQPSARYFKKIELKSFSKECINEMETSVSSQETATCLNSSAASTSSVETEGSNDCELSQLIDNLKSEHEEQRAKSRSATLKRAKPIQSRVRKLPRVQKLISRFEKP